MAERSQADDKGGGPSGLPPISRRSVIGGMAAGAIAPAVLTAAPLGSAAHVAVIGAGVFGAWTAEYLRRAGHRVTLVDMAGPANNRASSGGESRMTRAGYGRDSIYSKMALSSLKEWKALSAVSGLPIFVPHGVLFFTSKRDEYFDQSLAVNRSLGLPIQELDRAQLAKRFPMMDFAGIEMGMFEPGFGALMARRGVQTLVQRFLIAGGQYLHGTAHIEETSGPLRTVRLSTGLMEADAFVFALGSWLPKLFPGVLGRKIFATRQEVFFFAPPAGDRRFLPNAMPGWADFNGGDVYYGFPDLEARGVKFAHDTHGVRVNPDTQNRQSTAAALEEIVAFRDRRFPGLRNARLTESRVCQYENSSNGDFLIDRHPAMPNVVLVGGGSGHGFKHGPEVGRLTATFLMSQGAQAEPRFSLSTKAETQNREIH